MMARGPRSSVDAPAYWAKAKRELARNDAVLGEIIRSYPRIHLQSRGDPFHTLTRSIVGQQISVKAAQSVWDRLCATARDMTPDSLLALERAALRACGLSERKVEYITDLARHFRDGALHVHRWPGMEDDAVIEELTAVRGIGRWTAEMFLIFNLLRPDVLPLDDLGLQRAVSLAYRKGRTVTPGGLRRLAQAWRPWRSVATWYLWRSLDPLPVEY
jgi:DNA-3-methyladenine glycosylase II